MRYQGGPPSPINPDNSLSTSIAIVGIFMEFMRIRFTTTYADFPYKWYPDDKTTEILVLSAYDKITKARNKRPAITIRTQGFTTQSVGLGNKVEMSIKNQVTYYAAFENTTVVFTISAEKEGTVKELSELVKMALLECKTFLPGFCGIHDIGLPSGGSIMETAKDTILYETAIQIPVVYMIKWKEEINSPVLQGFITRLQTENESYYMDLATGVVASDVWVSLKDNDPELTEP